MLLSLESGLGLEIILWLQAHNSPPLVDVARLLHVLGGTFTYVALLAVILWAVNYSLGVRLLVVLAGSIALTNGLKALFARPRPFQAFPDQVTPLVAQEGYGLPSGHVLQALVVLGYLAWSLHDRRWLLLVALYVLLMAWSRMALGVHYPQDVVVGALVGGLWLGIVIRFGERFAAGWGRLSVMAQVGLMVLIGLGMLVVLWTADHGFGLAGVLTGGGLGLIWEARRVRMAAAGSIMQRVLRVGLGLLLLLALYLGLKLIFTPLTPGPLWEALRYALLGLAGLALWPWICVRVGLAGQRTGG